MFCDISVKFMGDPSTCQAGKLNLRSVPMISHTARVRQYGGKDGDFETPPLSIKT